MFGSGLPTGLMKIITVSAQRIIHKAQATGQTALFAAAAGAPNLPGSCAQQSASGIYRVTKTASRASVVRGHHEINQDTMKLITALFVMLYFSNQ
jgi:hypothetical protein